MAKRFVVLLSLVLAVSAVGLVSAATKHRHRATRHDASSISRFATISHKGTTGAPGASEVDAGITTAKLGRGATIQRVNFVSGLKFNGTSRDFYVPGTVKSTFRGSLVAHPDGSVSYSGSGRVTGGTGRFRGARGTFTFTGNIPKNSTVSTAITKGTIIY